MSACPTIAVNDGVEIAQLGFGVFQIKSGQAVDVVSCALETGYRRIDTASAIEGLDRGERLGADTDTFVAP